MNPFAFKLLSDSVHGTIGLSEVECAVIDSTVFQRLRNVAQLGLAKLAFPGADYSRFSHAIGVCHMTGRILRELRDNGSLDLDDEALQKYRLAGLLHDIGHYPFSHAFEQAIEDEYAGTLLVKKSEDETTNGLATKPALRHEEVGEQILTYDKEIKEILDRSGIGSEEIYALFKSGPDTQIKNLISADLDADRIDYLLRTSQHSGLPYGSIDVDYLLSQVRLDNENRICVTEKALKAADHFLLCRYFDYQQLVYHKTVTGFEQLLKQLFRQLIDALGEDYSAEGIRAMVEGGEWSTFDDASVISKLRAEIAKGKDDLLRTRAESVLQRRPPTLVAEMEYIDNRQLATEKNFFALRQAVLEKIPKWATDFGIDSQLWFPWSLPGAAITSIGATVSVEAPAKEMEDIGDEVSQLIHIMNKDGTSSPIVTAPNSLMKRLANYAVYTLRIYVVLDKTNKPRANEIRTQVKQDLPNHPWQDV